MEQVVISMVDIITYAMTMAGARSAAQEIVDQAITSIYTYRGQCTNAQLANKPKEAGAVYEITDNGTFVTGTDVVCNGTTWQAMAGQLHTEVVNTLDSASTTAALSAAMGKALDEGKADVATSLPTGKIASDTVTFQDLIDMGFISQ